MLSFWVEDIYLEMLGRVNENVNERTGSQGGSAMAVMCVDEWINKM